ncbi:rRNA-binding ribosome biosynthesis protein [Coemansia sp. RSA 552]|nr:rRNA-binding ribosome biosynthesis protein [Coemansia sp. RSA 552]
MGHGRRKRRTHAAPTTEELEKIPRALVVKSGHVGRAVGMLVNDVRRVMEPNTATRLKERKSNKVRDYVAVSSHLGLTHMLLFSQTETGTNLRIARIPRGPTLYFCVNKYSLAKDCLKLQRTPHSPSAAEFGHSPLIILNNFATGADEAGSKHLKLMTAMLQNMFPAINPSTMRLSEARRVVLFNYNDETGTIDFRHYTIVVKPVGVTKGVKRVLLAKTKDMPSLAKFDDISEYVLREAFASESDVEDGPENSVVLPQDYVGRGNTKNEQRAIRLLELGPRMELTLQKVESGMCTGEVIYHNYISKTKAEVAEAAKRRQNTLSQQAQRRKQQEANVKRKKEEAKLSKGKDKGKSKGKGKDDSGSESAEYASSDDDGDDDASARPEKPRLAADDFGADAYDEDLFDDSDVGGSDSDAAGSGKEMDVDSDAAGESDEEPAKRSKRAKRTAPPKAAKKNRRK